MATERLSMRKTREILRQKWALKRTHREVALSLGVSAGAVGGVVLRAQAAGLDWATAEGLGEEALEQRLYGQPATAKEKRPLPDPRWIHEERKRAGVTLELLHMEYREQQPNGYGYTQFCEHYRKWVAKHRLSMRQVHRGGEKLFIDYSGKKPHIVDRLTGEVQDVELFVSVLGASSFTYAEASLTQQVADFIASHGRAFEYFGGVAAALVPDQLKSGVTESSYYEPGIQRTYQEMATHYGTAVLPARPIHPKDKAKVEVGVQVAQRWILARLRNQTFFSLDELNQRIWDLLEDLNDRVMKVYGASRRQLFERHDKVVLRPLPRERFVYGEWKLVGVNVDYHVEVGRHYYSVPHGLVHQKLEARMTSTTVEIFHRGERVASHLRSDARGHHTTVAEHMPKAHQKQLEWTPTRIIHWASTVGPKTQALVEAILAERPHPEQGYRSCLGILRLGKRYTPERLEAACERAFSVRARSYRQVDAILKNGLDKQPLPETATTAGAAPVQHENLRGGDYYH